MMISETIMLLPAAYVLGSVPWGVILTALFSDVDIRRAGSGNIGAYNVYRLAGLRLGILTLAADLLKGALPVLLATHWTEASGRAGEVLVGLVALSAFAGHLYPVFLRFRGGKGVATAAGCFLIMSPFALFVSFLAYVLAYCISGYSSVGSLVAAAVLPGAVWLVSHSFPMTASAVLVVLFIFFRHRENVKRLMEGTEHTARG